jgi:hypothetical protein
MSSEPVAAQLADRVPLWGVVQDFTGDFTCSFVVSREDICEGLTDLRIVFE